MKRTTTFSVLAFLMLAFNGCMNQNHKSSDPEKLSLTGKWIRVTQAGLTSIDFKADNLVELDLGNDDIVEVVSGYKIQNDTVLFTDQRGMMCQEDGTYKIRFTPYYVSFDVIDDNCNGRVKTTMGFWIRPEHRDQIAELTKEIKKNDHTEAYLIRARMYMALGKSGNARNDLNAFIKRDSTNAGAYMNRAATCFPHDMQGALYNCDQAIALDPMFRNAYFLRGLALYELGEKEAACESFSMAIELGFSILRIAEEQKCADYWDKDDPKFN